MRRARGNRPLAIITIFCCLGISAFIGYARFGATSHTIRDQIQLGVQAAKTTRQISPEQEALLTIQLAIVDYTARNSAPPTDLNKLVPLYFDSVPKNPANNQSFYYQRLGKRYELKLSAEDKGTSVMASLSSKKEGKTEKKSAEPEYVNPNEMIIEEFVYDPSGKRDPFLPFDLSPKIIGDGVISPLEQYSLGQLRLAAVLMSEADPTAIVEDSSGRGYTVRQGTKIGNTGGVVVKIEKDVLKILESHVDFTGQEIQRVVEMKLVGEVNDKGKKKRKRN